MKQRKCRLLRTAALGSKHESKVHDRQGFCKVEKRIKDAERLWVFLGLLLEAAEVVYVFSAVGGSF